MGFAVPFVGFNRWFNPPKGREDTIAPVVAFGNGNVVVTAWQFTAEEIQQINRNNGKVFVAVMSGTDFIPTLVGSSESVRQMLIDHGGTFPKQPEEVIA